jgi:hypothetical protein
MNGIDLLPEDARCKSETDTNVFVAHDLMYSQMGENYTMLYRLHLIGWVIMHIGLFIPRKGLACLGMFMMLIGWALYHREKYRHRLHLTVTCEGLIVDDVHVKPKCLPFQLVLDYDKISVSHHIVRRSLPFQPIYDVYVFVTTDLLDDRLLQCVVGSYIRFGMPSLSEANKFVDLAQAMERSITAPVAPKNIVEVERTRRR